MARRRAQGWHYAEGRKNLAVRHSPTLVAWADLPEDERAKTRETLRKLPATLAHAGFQIVRLPLADPAVVPSSAARGVASWPR